MVTHESVSPFFVERVVGGGETGYRFVEFGGGPEEQGLMTVAVILQGPSLFQSRSYVPALL